MADIDSTITEVSAAYHEAGHAVVAMYFQKDVTRLTIVPEGDRVGGCERPHVEDIDSLYSGDDTIVYTMETIMIALAGEISQARFEDREADHKRPSCESDVDIADEFAYAEEKDQELADALIAWLSLKTRNLLTTPFIWYKVQRLADSLCSRKELDAEEVRQIYNEATDELMSDANLLKREQAKADEAFSLYRRRYEEATSR